MSVPFVKGNGPPEPDKAGLEKLSKAKLIELILEQREAVRIQLEDKDKQITELSEQLAKLQSERETEKDGQTIKDINRQANEPTSKKPEWDKDGNPKKKKKNKKGKRKKRPGCGNVGKSDLTPDETHFTPWNPALAAAKI
jgi:hypothetical protein